MMSYLLAGLILMLPTEPAVIWTKHPKAMIEQAVAIPGYEFNESYVLRLSRQFLATHASIPVIRYLVVTNQQDALEKLRGPGISDIDFPSWRQMYLSESRTPPETAELIKIRGNAAVRIRFINGSIVQRVLLGGDPFVLVHKGKPFRVVGLAPVFVPDNVSETVEFFIQTPTALARSEAEIFAASFRSHYALPQAVLTMGNCTWFSSRSNYPIYNRFLPFVRPPTLEEWMPLRMYFCMRQSGACMELGPTRTP